MGRLLGLLLMAGALLAGCASEPESPRAESTAKMAERLKTIADEAEANPTYSLYVNKARAERIASFNEPQNPRAWVDYTVKLAEEQLRAGMNEQAIANFQTVLSFAQKRGAPESFRLAIKDYLAISNMRLGEMRNCVANHNAQRCVYPIQGKGVHTQKEGARRAFDLYQEILTTAPDDLNSRWLLNVAAMTLGTYPDSVSDRWHVPVRVGAEDADFPRFQDVSGPLGVDVMGLSGGVVVDDLNGDGNPDILASSWGLRDQVRYFQSTGDGGFVERTDAAGLTGLLGGLNMIQADYNNDGHTDVLILRGAWYPDGHPNSLLRNDGDGTFTDVTVRAGLDGARPTQTADWADFDGDGDLDLFIGNETSRSGDTRWGPTTDEANPCALYRNNGDGTFTNIAAEVGLDVTSYVKAVVWGDIENDGDPDLYLSSWDSPNRLFRNDGRGPDGTWQFTNVTEQAGVEEPVESFPAWFWDYDNDGYQDLFVSGWRASSGDMAAEALGRPVDAEMPRLYHNDGDGTFTEVTGDANLRKVMFSMGSNFGDLDNDGWQDFYVGTGDPDFRTLIPNRMFRNTGDGRFTEVTAPGGFGHLQKGHAVAFADMDHDGDQDIYAVMGGAFEGDVFHNVLFENPGFDHHWITLRLEGTTANRSAIGARVRVVVEEEGDTRTLHRTVGTGGSFGASSLQLEIGLGTADALRHIEVTWPGSGQVQRFTNVAMDQVVHIREGTDEATPVEIDPFDLNTRPQ